MFDIGFWEIGLLFIVLLLVVGPERLPRVVRTIGLWVGKARRMVSDVKAEVDRELRLDELKRSLRDETQSDELKRLSQDLRSVTTDLRRPDFQQPSRTEQRPPPPAVGTTPPASPRPSDDPAKGE